MPEPGKPEKKRGLPYVWVTWLAGLLAGKQCVWAVWFQARYDFVKYDPGGGDLAKWSAEHDRMMKARAAELVMQGYAVMVEEENKFKLEGSTAVLAGKMDLVGVMKAHKEIADHTVVIDGKTGQKRHSDWWQVLIYLYALARCRKDLPQPITGELHYKRGDERQSIEPEELTAGRKDEIEAMMKRIASETVPARVPSANECKFCKIGPADCPVRYRSGKPTTTDAW